MMQNEARRIVAVCVLVGIGILVGGCPVIDIVTFPDAALDQAIRTKLDIGWGFVTRAKLLRLKTLDLSGLGIQELKGLENCTSLTWLDLSSTDTQANYVSDVVPLGDLKNLTWLNLDSNQVSNIHPLEDLTNLTYLNLENNDISDIAPLAGLFYLNNLLLSENEIWDLAPLVANAENGGMGYGSIISVSQANLVDENGQLWPDIADQINRMVLQGVTVILTEPETGS